MAEEVTTCEHCEQVRRYLTQSGFADYREPYGNCQCRCHIPHRMLPAPTRRLT